LSFKEGTECGNRKDRCRQLEWAGRPFRLTSGNAKERRPSVESIEAPTYHAYWKRKFGKNHVTYSIQ